jgi:hypothetical protein
MDALTIHIFSCLFVKCTLVIYLEFKTITIICLDKFYDDDDVIVAWSYQFATNQSQSQISHLHFLLHF